MTNGVLLFAYNNEQIDYVAQACYLANRVQQYMNLPTTLVTDDKARVEKYYNGNEVFDNIIEVSSTRYNKKRYHDGALSHKVLDFKNFNRDNAYNVSPYDQTLVLDTDYIISNDLLLNCFNSVNDLMVYSKSLDISGWRETDEFDLISETSIKFYWATVVFFRKTTSNKMFFNLITHIKENYEHYRNLYQLTNSVYRNDFAFSIAIHIMAGQYGSGFVKELPGKMIYSTGKDILEKVKDDELTLLVEKENRSGEYTLLKSKGINLHVMNKFSLNRNIANA